MLYISIILLGISFMISSLIIARSLDKLVNKNFFSTINGSLNVSNSDYNNKIESDVLLIYDAEIMLGYEPNTLRQDIQKGKLEGIPYTKVGTQYLFSKKALEEWVYNRSKEQ